MTCSLCFQFPKAQKTQELETLRLSLTDTRMSQVEHSQINLQHDAAEASLRETFTQETSLLRAGHQSELDLIRLQNQEQQEKLRELHHKDMGETSVLFVLNQCCSSCLPLSAFNLCAITDVATWSFV